jgi:arabinan endo-1,5-alpha-L-arabinosidase
MLLHRLIPFAAALVFLHPVLCQGPRALPLTGDYPLAHDPSIAKDGNTYYVFTTSGPREEKQLPIRCSTDLLAWKHCGYVFDQIPAWIHESSPKTRNLWAPDISFFKGKYHLYYAYSSFGVNTSGIALATNETLDPNSPKYHWNDEGLVLRSAATDDFNAIDPNIVFDSKGKPWLSFGSFWSGINMRSLDAKTGKLSRKDTKTYSLASRARPENAAPAKPGFPADWQAIEAPFIVRHGDFYFLFVSFDLCCRGTHSNYRIMVGRSRKITGPYVDAEGKPMLEGGGTQLLVGNGRWLGPGGQSVLQQADRDYLVFHAYDASTGKPALQISTITWEDGWPNVALRIDGESK